jgi:hypothetical protein
MRGVVVAALALAGASAALAFLSGRPALSLTLGSPVYLLTVSVLLGAGVAYLAGVRALGAVAPQQALAMAVITVAVGLGAMQLNAAPAGARAEVNRHLLAGGLTACGSNPYSLTPAERRRAVAAVRALGPQAGDAGCLTGDSRWQKVLANVERPGQPELTPPFMQYWFAATVKLGGPSLFSLRVSYLIAEVIALGALCLLLARLGASPLQLAVVGWAPLVFKDLLNSGHYQMVPLALVTLAALLLVSQRHLLSAVVLGLTCTSDFLGLLLVPLWLRATPPGRRLVALSLVALTVGLVWAPFAGSVVDVAQGTAASLLPAKEASPVFAGLVGLLVKVGVPQGSGAEVALGLVGGLAVLVAAAYPLGQGPREAMALRGGLVALAVALIGAPVLSLSRLAWLLPLVALEAQTAWLVLVASLPVLSFEPYLARHGMAAYRIWVVSAPFVVFALLAGAGLVYRNRSSSRGRIRSAARA